MLRLLLLAGISTPAVGAIQTPAPATAWAAPIARAFQQYGPERVPSLGLQSLTYFSSIGLDFQTRIEAEPGLAVPLIAQLDKLGLDIEAFSTLSAEGRLTALQKAARAAEDAADQEAALFLKRAGDDFAALSYQDADELTGPAENLWRSSLPYLSMDLRFNLHSLRTRIAQLKEQRERLQEQFVRELPKKIAEETLSWNNTYSKTAGRWLIADYSPVESFRTLREAFAARIAELDKSTPGFWSREILDTMEKTLLEPSVQREVDLEGGAAEMIQLQGLVARAQDRLERRLGKPDAKLSRALSAMREYNRRGTVPSLARIESVYEAYDDFPFASSTFPMRMRISHWLERWHFTDSGAYPAWKDLREMRMLAHRRAGKRLNRVSLAGAASIVAMPFTSGWLHGAAIALAVVLTILVFILDWKHKTKIYEGGPGKNTWYWMDDYLKRIGGKY